ncbi:MAG: efflux RND transporter periplasmic adaptor subunit [Verrucomicrobia bacterium]|nr:efflux RND transporter periplasmic adaptor subunit [Verrucomicrobiota bacterium]
MNRKSILQIIVVAALAGAIGWFARQQWPTHAPMSAVVSGRKIKFYQSAMHPWVTSDKPGKCTVCGMALVPVYEGDAGFALDSGLVTLSSNSINVLHVQTEEVKRRPLERALRVAGTIDDSDTQHRRLSAYVDGRIEKLFVNYLGAEVIAGQPLASFYSPMLLAAEREYVTLRCQDHSKLAGGLLVEHQRLVDAATQRLLRLGLAQSQINALPQKSENDSYTEILAPMSGTVVAREVYAGQYVKEGDRLFELGDFATMWFVFDAYERDLAWIQPGQSVEVTTPARPGKIYSAAITFIDPNLNETTRSAKVRVEIPNPLVEENGVKRRELFHKLYAQGVVKVVVPDALTVPRGAVLSPGAQPVVYVEKGGGAFEQRRVRLGRAGDEFWEVLAELDEGDRVVTTGNLLIDAQAQLNQSAHSSTNQPGL